MHNNNIRLLRVPPSSLCSHCAAARLQAPRWLGRRTHKSGAAQTEALAAQNKQHDTIFTPRFP